MIAIQEARKRRKLAKPFGDVLHEAKVRSPYFPWWLIAIHSLLLAFQLLWNDVRMKKLNSSEKVELIEKICKLMKGKVSGLVLQYH